MYYKYTEAKGIQSDVKGLTKVKKRFSYEPSETELNKFGFFEYEEPEMSEYQVRDELIKVENKITSTVRDMTLSEKNEYIKNRDFKGKNIKIIAPLKQVAVGFAGFGLWVDKNPDIETEVKIIDGVKISYTYLNSIDDDIMPTLIEYSSIFTIVPFNPELEIIIE